MLKGSGVLRRGVHLSSADLRLLLSARAVGTVNTGGGGAELGTSLPSRLPFSTGVATYYVDPVLGNDNLTSTQAQNPSTPWRTINKAVSTVTAAGSIIELADGVYQSGAAPAYVCLISGRNIVGGSANPITIRAANEGGAVIKGSAMGGAFTLGSFIFNSSGWRLQGLRFSVQGINSAAVQIESSSKIELYRCTFVDTGEISVKTRGAVGTPATDIWVHSCLFAPSGEITWQRIGSQWVNAPTALTFCAGLDTGHSGGMSHYYGTRGSHCLYLGQCSGAETGQGGSLRNVVTNCIFTGMTPGRHCELGPQAVETYVVNNTFFGNDLAVWWNTVNSNSFRSDFAGSGVEFFANVQAFATRNNIIANNIFSTLFGHAAYGSNGFNLTGNQVFNNLAHNLSNGFNGSVSQMENRFDDYHQTRNGNVIFTEPGGNLPGADPLFLNPHRHETGDFTLLAGSPAIGAALPEYCPSTNYDGDARDSTPNLGAL